jgi:competence protein ComEC
MNMALGPWIALATLSALLWWPGSLWEAGPPELIAMVLLGMVLTGGRRALLVALPVACTLLQADRHLADRLPARLDGRDFLVRGQVCDFPRQSRRAARFAFHLDPDSRTQGLPPRVQLAWYEASEAPRAGETWWLKVRLREIRGAASPGAFDFERVALVDHIGARGYVRASALNRRVAAGGWQCPTMPLRAWLAQRVTVALGEHIAAPYLLAITVGARQGLERGDWARLRDTGTAHLMAISGLHIGLVAGFALLLGRGPAGGRHPGNFPCCWPCSAEARTQPWPGLRCPRGARC